MKQSENAIDPTDMSVLGIRQIKWFFLCWQQPSDIVERHNGIGTWTLKTSLLVSACQECLNCLKDKWFEVKLGNSADCQFYVYPIQFSKVQEFSGIQYL